MDYLDDEERKKKQFASWYSICFILKKGWWRACLKEKEFNNLKSYVNQWTTICNNVKNKRARYCLRRRMNTINTKSYQWSDDRWMAFNDAIHALLIIYYLKWKKGSIQAKKEFNVDFQIKRKRERDREMEKLRRKITTKKASAEWICLYGSFCCDSLSFSPFLAAIRVILQ